MTTSSLGINNQHRRKGLFYIVLIVIGMMLLAGSLTTLRFSPGTPIPGAETSETSSNPVIESNNPVTEERVPTQLPLVITFLLITVLIVSALAKKINFIKTIKLSIGLVVALCLFLLLNLIKFPSPTSSQGNSQGFEIKPTFVYLSAPIGNPPIEMYWIVIIALLIGAVFFIRWLLCRASNESQKDDLIANEAGAALDAIKSGGDLRNVIIHCYLQMLRIAVEEQGIKRLNSVTPREFESMVIKRGIPYGPIHELTTLFEKVRYGSKPTSPADEKTAIECLSHIQSSFQTRERE